MKTMKLVVISSHTLGGGRYADVGDIYELDEGEAKLRIARGLVKEAPAEPPAPPAPAPAGSPGGSGAGDPPPPSATDAAIKLAEENGVDLAQVTGTGADGRITQPDVQKFIDERAGA